MTQIICRTVIDASKIDWNGKSGSQELSMLTHDRNGPVLSQVWDDSCDEGVLVRGKNETVVFVVVGLDYSGEDVAGWRLKSICSKTNRVDDRFELLIIND